MEPNGVWDDRIIPEPTFTGAINDMELFCDTTSIIAGIRRRWKNVPIVLDPAGRIRRGIIREDIENRDDFVNAAVGKIRI